MLGAAIAATRYGITDTGGNRNLWTGAAGCGGIGMALAGVGLCQLRRYHRAYPRLTVDPAGITYQPDARVGYELPWTELARVEVMPARAGQPPALLAIPKPESSLPGQPAYVGLPRDDSGAFRIDQLTQILNERAGDLLRLMDAVAHRQAR
jgi:hypothetical protein